MRKRVTIEIRNGQYHVRFLNADGSEATTWDYVTLRIAAGDIDRWIGDAEEMEKEEQ